MPGPARTNNSSPRSRRSAATAAETAGSLTPRRLGGRRHGARARHRREGPELGEGHLATDHNRSAMARGQHLLEAEVASRWSTRRRALHAGTCAVRLRTSVERRRGDRTAGATGSRGAPRRRRPLAAADDEAATRDAGALDRHQPARAGAELRRDTGAEGRIRGASRATGTSSIPTSSPALPDRARRRRADRRPPVRIAEPSAARSARPFRPRTSAHGVRRARGDAVIRGRGERARRRHGRVPPGYVRDAVRDAEMLVESPTSRCASTAGAPTEASSAAPADWVDPPPTASRCGSTGRMSPRASRSARVNPASVASRAKPPRPLARVGPRLRRGRRPRPARPGAEDCEPIASSAVPPTTSATWRAS
jgi:hypothetical protein